MHIHPIGYRIRGVSRGAARGSLWDMTPKDAQRRLEILGFFAKHGGEATLDAFGVSRRTLSRWKAALKAEGGTSQSPGAKSCAPQPRRETLGPEALARNPGPGRRRRTPRTDPRLGSEIRRVRWLSPNLGKAKLPVLHEPEAERAWETLQPHARGVLRSRSPSWTTTRSYCAPTLPSSTARWPSG